jgi:hypothetical protein
MYAEIEDSKWLLGSIFSTILSKNDTFASSAP